jgi:hypothetical protein
MKRPSHLHLSSAIQPGKRDSRSCAVSIVAVDVEVQVTEVRLAVLIPYARFLEVRARRQHIITELTSPDRPIAVAVSSAPIPTDDSAILQKNSSKPAESGSMRGRC